MKKLICLAVFMIISCDLDKRYPKKGTFCRMMVTPMECVDVDFEGRQIQINGESIPLEMKFRVLYYFIQSGAKKELRMLNEHRIEIKNPDSPEGAVYIRKKEKRK
ncbi:MAG TPA: hypothetical protein PL048_09055 [Leptospiraceae bacterium]|nr:hypothetical protein [Leptospiraceae bacterium]HMY69000.1 hypothetical protein [Leptospiraceae bacterium]HMZ58910.1 hypothetical protein [Leptospiraceae bacterium]HNF14841.1 hypothetical protein [Leptospiraceae bacterium]HNF23116.1 hypothetical protein [Leptospiraceae bacterium]